MGPVARMKIRAVEAVTEVAPWEAATAVAAVLCAVELTGSSAIPTASAASA